MDAIPYAAHQHTGFYSTSAIEAGFIADRSDAHLRQQGVTFTPQRIVELMLSAVSEDAPADAIIVDVGAGAGRFALAAARKFPSARVLAVEIDESLARSLATDVSRSALSDRIEVVNTDFLEWPFPDGARSRIFLGNPPYVRHHSLSHEQKAWLQELGKKSNRNYSGLSGLHVYFLLRCLLHGRPGDRLFFILPSEWLETRYGTAIKQTLIDRCSEIKLYLFSPADAVFGQTMTTSLILDARLGSPTGIVRSALVTASASALAAEPVRIDLSVRTPARDNWLRSSRCALNLEPEFRYAQHDEIALGELFDVHRGQVTGRNSIWISSESSRELIPERFLFPAVTDAKEVLDLAEDMLVKSNGLRCVIDLPADLAQLEGSERVGIDKFLSYARAGGAADSYIARHRRPWWRVGLKPAPPVIMTYMARRAPRFVINKCNARLLNIAHGLYPKIPLSDEQLCRIVQALNSSPTRHYGRTYAGGLTKIEPGDACEIRLPACAVGDASMRLLQEVS